MLETKRTALLIWQEICQGHLQLGDPASVFNQTDAGSQGDPPHSDIWKCYQSAGKACLKVLPNFVVLSFGGGLSTQEWHGHDNCWSSGPAAGEHGMAFNGILYRNKGSLGLTSTSSTILGLTSTSSII